MNIWIDKIIVTSEITGAITEITETITEITETIIERTRVIEILR